MSLSAFSSGAPVGYTYHYDQLNRIKDLRQHSGIVGWSAGNINPGYREDFTFDGNGNILSAIRTAATAAVEDSLFYQYNKTAGRLNNNRLNYLNGTGAASSFGPPQIPGNYQYDANGELTTDKQAGLSNIKWSVYGKILSITKGKGTITYTYNPAGERVSKTVGGLTTFYIRDAQGNTLAVYDNKNDSVFWREQHLYGSSRIGMWTPNVNLADSNALAVWDSVGYKEYEGDNHLGNVNVTLSDIRTPHYDGSGNLLYYTANVKTSQDYYAYGALQPGRQFVDTSGVYRYGFNGKENDNEVKGTGNQQDYGMRIYDPRVGRFLSVDPIAKSYPELTPYQFASNKPIQAIDLDGLEAVQVQSGMFGTLFWPKLQRSQWYFVHDGDSGFHTDETSYSSAANYNTVHGNTSAYQGIEQRHDYYQWVDKKVSSKSKWFDAAATVTQWNAVGAADNVNMWYLNDSAEKFLQEGNKYLFSYNMDNAKNLMSGTLNKSFTDANGALVKLRGLSGKPLDYALVQLEQTKVQDFIGKYQKNNPGADMNSIMNSINGSMGAKFAPSAIKKVMDEKFNGGKSFNFKNYDDRVKLGQSLIDQLYDSKKGK